MKKVLMLAFAIMITVMFTATGFAQRPGAQENSATPERMEKEKPAKEMKAHKKMKKGHKKMEKETKKEGPAREPDHRE
jgi:acid phosphatase family membrane protein YuiD